MHIHKGKMNFNYLPFSITTLVCEGLNILCKQARVGWIHIKEIEMKRHRFNLTVLLFIQSIQHDYGTEKFHALSKNVSISIENKSSHKEIEILEIASIWEDFSKKRKKSYGHIQLKETKWRKLKKQALPIKIIITC